MPRVAAPSSRSTVCSVISSCSCHGGREVSSITSLTCDTQSGSASWTGETFTLAELEGTVYVEPMATWCSNCRTQLGNVQAAQAQVGEGDVTFVALSVETTLEPAALAEYADEQGFDFTFAVMTPELLRALAAEFGQSVANPPATPHFVVYPDGTWGDLMTGFSPPDAVLSALSPQ